MVFFTKKCVFPTVSLAAICAFGASGSPAQAPPGAISIPTTREARGLSIVYTRSQKSQIERAERDASRISCELAKARQRLVSLQLAALPAGLRSDASIGHATVGIISSETILTGPEVTLGFETDDDVAFVRKDAIGGSMVTGTGRVERVYPDSLELLVTANSKGIKPDDEVYIIGRAELSVNLAKLLK